MPYEHIQNIHYCTNHFQPAYLKKGHPNKFPQQMRREPKIFWQQPRKYPRRNKNELLVYLLVAMKNSKTFYKNERLTRIAADCLGPLNMFKFYETLKTQHMVLTNPSLQCNPFRNSSSSAPLPAFNLFIAQHCPFVTNCHILCRLLCYFDQIYSFKRRHNAL